MRHDVVEIAVGQGVEVVGVVVLGKEGWALGGGRGRSRRMHGFCPLQYIYSKGMTLQSPSSIALGPLGEGTGRERTGAHTQYGVD